MALWRRHLPRSTSYNGVEYQNVPEHEHNEDAVADDDLLDGQFLPPPVSIPWSGVIFAAVLFVGGGTLLCLGALLLTGYIDPMYVDRTWPLLVLGAVMFIPGVYHIRIALFASLGFPGYSYDDIPSFD